MLVGIKPRTVKPLFGSVQVNWGHPLSRGLVSAFLMNETGGQTIYNLAAPQFVGTLNTAVTWAVGGNRIGTPPRLWFDGTSGLVTTTSAILTTTPSAFSMVASALSNVGGVTRIVCNETKAASLTWGLYWNLNDTWRFTVDSATTNAIGTATVNVKTHLVGVFDSKAAAKESLYAQGTLVGTSNVGATALTGEVFDLGARTDTTLPWSGFIDFVLLYQRALSPQEVSWLFAEPYSFLQPIPAMRYWSTSPAAAAAASVVTPRLLALTGVGS